MPGPKKGTPKVEHDFNGYSDKQEKHTYVYTLDVWNPLSNNWEEFYVGKTNNPTRRKREHELASKTRHETVYQTVRQIEKLKFEWTLDVKHTIPESLYVSQEKDLVINLMLRNETCPEEEQHNFIRALYLYDDINFTSDLSNMIMGSAKWKKTYEAKLKIMKDNGFKTLKELSKYEEEERNRKKSETLADRIRQKAEQNAKELAEAQTLKARIKANPEFQAGIAKMKADRIVAEENAKNLMKLIRR